MELNATGSSSSHCNRNFRFVRLQLLDYDETVVPVEETTGDGAVEDVTSDGLGIQEGAPSDKKHD